MARMASARSRMTPKRWSNGVPWFSISSRFQPAPMPSSTRPPDSRSSVATSLAVTIGSRWMSSEMPVPRRRRSVTIAAAVRAMNGSRMRW